MLNSVYGKTTEKPFTEIATLSNSADKSSSIINSTFSHFIYPHSEELELVTGILKEKNVLYGITNKPLQWGIFILDYTKEKMYNEIFSRGEVYYSDTDSALIKTSFLNTLVKNGIISIGKDFGDYEIEMDKYGVSTQAIYNAIERYSDFKLVGEEDQKKKKKKSRIGMKKRAELEKLRKKLERKERCVVEWEKYESMKDDDPHIPSNKRNEKTSKQ
ncbi:hypothetical protein IIV6-T1_458, partial [Invertebrate iridescent virus 6]